MKTDLLSRETWFDGLTIENASAVAAEIERRFKGQEIFVVHDNPAMTELEIMASTRLASAKAFCPTSEPFAVLNLRFGRLGRRLFYFEAAPDKQDFWSVTFKGDLFTLSRRREGDSHRQRFVIKIIEREDQ